MKWKDVSGFEGFYQVSDQGEVRSVDRMVPSKHGSKRLAVGRVLKQVVGREGYCRVCLTANGKRAHPNVHRLVAIAFLKQENGLNVVDHIDTIKTNNNVSNLRWTTDSGNCKNPITTSRRKRPRPERRGRNSPQARAVINETTGEHYAAVVDAATAVGVCPNSIRQAIRNGTRSAGYHWRYEHGKDADL